MSFRFSGKDRKWICHIVFAVLLIFSVFFEIKAEKYSFVPIEVKQPDNSIIKCFTSGDEFYHWLHDANGFTIIQSPTDGYFYYARLENDSLVASTFKVGKVNPSEVGLKPWAKISVTDYSAIRDQRTRRLKSTAGLSTGTLTNIVVYLRFKNEAEFTQTRSVFNTMLNDASISSLKGYYNEVSYNKLALVSSQYPVCDLTTNLSYEDINERGYYSPYNAVTNPIGYTNDSGDREQALVARVINAIKSEISSSEIIDANNDGYVDNVTIVVHGNADGWGNLLWPHQWWLYKQTVYINTKQVGNYIFITENMFDVSTICHEMFHVIGAPDLYHYTDNGIDPIGSWSGGITHVTAFMKWKYSGYSWITNIPEITKTGTYSVRPLLNASNNCYKIKSPYSATEYFVLEFRKSSGLYESHIPAPGLLITRINTLASGNGNGPPDEVYVCRPQGSPFSNGNVSLANFVAILGRGTFNSTSNPRCFLSDGSDAGINISNIVMYIDSVRFNVQINNPALSKTGWTVKTDSYENGSAYNPGIYAIDNSPSTIWHTPWSTTTVPYPHWIEVNFGKQVNIRGLKYLPRQDMENGRIKDYDFMVSNDGTNYTPVISGSFLNTTDLQVVSFPEQYCRYAKLIAKKEVNDKAFASMAEFDFVFNNTLVSKTNWSLLNASSYQAGYDPALAYDGKGTTYWQSNSTATYPHELSIDMADTFCISSASYLPRQDNIAGTIAKYGFYGSLDGTSWNLLSTGTWANNSAEKFITFAKTTCRYIKLIALTEVQGKGIASIAELSVYGEKTHDVVAPNKPLNFRINSRTGNSLNLVWDPDNTDKTILNYKLISQDGLLGYSYSNTFAATIDSTKDYKISLYALDGSGNTSDSSSVDYLSEVKTGLQQNKSKLPVITYLNGSISVNGLNGFSRITVYDILGRKQIYLETFETNAVLPVSIRNGIVIVCVDTSNSKASRQKIYINNVDK